MKSTDALALLTLLVHIPLVTSQLAPVTNPTPGDCTPWLVWKADYYFQQGSPFATPIGSAPPTLPPNPSSTGFPQRINLFRSPASNPIDALDSSSEFSNNFIIRYISSFTRSNATPVNLRVVTTHSFWLKIDSGTPVTGINSGALLTLDFTFTPVANQRHTIELVFHKGSGPYELRFQIQTGTTTDEDGNPVAVFQAVQGHLPRASCPACGVDETSSAKTCASTGMVGLTGDTVTANTNLALSGCGVTPNTLTFPDATFTTKQLVTFADTSICSLSYSLSDQCLGDQWGVFTAKTGTIPFTAATGCSTPPPPSMNLTSAQQEAVETCDRRVILTGVNFPVGNNSFMCDFNIGVNTQATFTSSTSGFCVIPKAVSSSPLQTRLTLFSGSNRFTVWFLSSPNCCDQLCLAGQTCTNSGPFAFNCTCDNGGQPPLCQTCQDVYRVEIKTSSKPNSGTTGSLSIIFIGSLGRSGSHNLKTGFVVGETSAPISITLNSCIGTLYAIQLDNTQGATDSWRVETINVFDTKAAGIQIGWFGLNEIVGARRVLENPFPIVARTKDSPQAAATEKAYISCEDSMRRLGATNTPGSLPAGQTFTFSLFYFNIQNIVKCTLWTPSLDDWIVDEFVINRRGVNYFFNNPDPIKIIVRANGFTDFTPFDVVPSPDLPSLPLGR